jgi:hypothetical protein
VAAFLRFGGRVYLKLDGLELLVVCFAFLAVDFVVLGVIILFENASGWILWKIGRDSMQLQKPNSYISFWSIYRIWLFLIKMKSLYKNTFTAYYLKQKGGYYVISP